MRKGLSKEDTFRLRRMIDPAEGELEVSDFEKTSSHLAYLMSLYIRFCPRVQEEFLESIGQTELVGQLSRPQREWLKRASVEMGFKRRYLFVPFNMWRSWSLQEELKGAYTVRNGFEWLDLSTTLRDQREQMIDQLKLMGEDLCLLRDELPVLADEAAYLLGNITGSPMAVIKATENLLESKVRELQTFRKRVLLVYGFGPHHRPNKRFDKMARKNIETFFYWLHMGERDRFLRYCWTAADGQRREKPAAREAAIKVASHFELVLESYESALRSLHRRNPGPAKYYARRLNRPC